MELRELLTEGHSPSVINFWLDLCHNRLKLDTHTTADLLRRQLGFDVLIKSEQDGQDTLFTVSRPCHTVSWMVYASYLSRYVRDNYSQSIIKRCLYLLKG